MAYILKNTGAAGDILIRDSGDGQITTGDVQTYDIASTSYVDYYNESGTFPYVRAAKVSNDSQQIYVSYGRATGFLPGTAQEGIMSGPNPMIICAVRVKYTDESTTPPTEYDYLNIRCSSSTSRGVEHWVDQYNNGELGTDGWLYRGDWADSQDLIEEIRDWDESPSTDPEDDPFNENPQGGEFAELGDFDETYLQLLSELPEPETLDYGHFLTAYQLDSGNLVDIGDFLFDTNFWTSLKNKFEGLSDPLSMIVSAVEIPFTLGAVPTTFKLGGIEVENGEGQAIMCAKHSTRYLKYNFGSIKLMEVWGTAKDYTDCDISIFLPYVGMRRIDADLGVNSVLTLAVIIDVWTGDLNYMLEVNNTSMQNKYYGSAGVPFRWSGNCGNKIPIGKVDPSTPILNVAASLGSMALGAGMMMAAGPAGTAAAGSMAAGGMAAGAGAASAGAGAGMMLSGAKGFMHDLNHGFSPIAQSSGNISGALGYMDFQYPYLVIKRGIPSYPNNWRAEFGAPRFQEFLVSSLSGYTEFADIHADAINGASDDEKAMIEDYMKAGVIL